MRWTEERVEHVLLDLIDQNPLAVRPVLRVARRRFTDSVPTLAVTLTDPPELLINLEFVRAHCRTEDHLKAVLLHEFLHVLLGHTQRFQRMTEVENLALDAAINAIVYRSCPEEVWSFFSEYYAKAKGIWKLLRPMRSDEERTARWSNDATPLDRAWWALLEGRLLAEDVLDLARTMAESDPSHAPRGRVLIGNHDGTGGELAAGVRAAVEESLRQMDGSGIWRSPGAAGVGPAGSQIVFAPADVELERWKARTLAVLRRAVLPDPKRGWREPREAIARVPILSPRDRRAFLRATWSPFLPEADNVVGAPVRFGTANVYLDVSGSMHGEMPVILALLGKVRQAIRMPFWAFSDVVSPARIVDGKLVTESTGGTSIDAVLAHLAATSPRCAVVVTDGYVGTVPRNLLEACKATRITALVTRSGSTAALEAAGIPTVQLEGFPR